MNIATQKISVIIKTKSNYRNLNGIPLEVVELRGTRVSCRVFDTEANKNITVDFTLKEVVSFN